MTDLEIMKLCAEAMGGKLMVIHGEWYLRTEHPDPQAIASDIYFNLLHDDAQAMALVKRLGLFISRLAETWYVDASDNGTTPTAEHPTNLNRCICECVVRLQQAKQK